MTLPSCISLAPYLLPPSVLTCFVRPFCHRLVTPVRGVCHGGYAYCSRFRNTMRNLLALLAALAVGLGSALAQQGTGPLLGPGNVGEKDEKGRVKGAGAGEGPHLDFNHMQLERRVDRPEGEAEKDH